MTTHTERQRDMLLAWLDMELERPSRTDRYLMQIACEVRRIFSKNPNAIQIEQFLLKYKSRGAKPLDVATASALSKASWLGRMGMKVTRIVKPKEASLDHD